MANLKKLNFVPARTFVIGDIHGCASELQTLLDYLKGSLSLAEEDLVIFIGDYIDRGPATKQVIDLLIALQKEHTRSIFLKGNHEDMLLSFLGYPGRMGNVYLPNGGMQTLASYGLGSSIDPEKTLSCMPAGHLEFFQMLDDYVELGDFVFVHAGLSPIRALTQQDEDDLFWIRDEFIMNIHRFEKIIIFGHTPYHRVMFHLPYKIGIDTGLVYGNKLSCLELNSQTIYQVSSGSALVEVSAFSDWVEE